MRHTASTLLSLGTLSCLLPAQNNRDLFWPNEGATLSSFPFVSLATRVGGANNATVELLSDRSAQLARGLGAATNTSCQLSGMVYVVQDSDRSTANTFTLLARKATAPDGPADLTGYVFKTGTISTPVSGTGAGAWLFTTGFTPPLPTLPCENGYYLGVELSPQLSATDVLNGWTANLYTPATTATGASGTNPRIPTPKWHAALVDGTPFVFTRTGSTRTLAINGLFSAPVLNIANIDPTGLSPYTCYGLGGAYPDCTGGTLPTDGIEMRVQDDSNLGGLGAIVFGTGFLPGGSSLGGFYGALWVNPVGLTQVGNFVLPAATPAIVKTTIVPPGVIPAVTGLQLTFQAVTVSSSFTNGRLTNAVSTNL